MLYGKNGQVYYYAEGNPHDAELYNLTTMKRQSNADMSLMNFTFQRTGMTVMEYREDFVYELILDFYSNGRNSYIDPIIDSLILFFTTKGFRVEVSETPLRFIVHPSGVSNIIDVIRDQDFQLINAKLSIGSFAFWKLTDHRFITYHKVIIADHKTKKATMTIMDLNTGVVPYDFKGQRLADMLFPYENIAYYSEMFNSLGNDNGGLEYYTFLSPTATK
jgi:hypothetical protein